MIYSGISDSGGRVSGTHFSGYGGSDFSGYGGRDFSGYGGRDFSGYGGISGEGGMIHISGNGILRVPWEFQKGI